MKILKTAMVVFACLLVTSVMAGNRQTKVFLFGFAASFNDSTVYFTDIQTLDGAWVSSKNNFLLNRDNYSYQLRDYLASQGEEHRTCMVSYAFSEKEILRKMEKLKSRYTSGLKNRKGGHSYNIKQLSSSDFHFNLISNDDSE